MKILNILVSGNAGGIEVLCNNIDKNADIKNYWIFLFEGGIIAEEMLKRSSNSVYILGYKKIFLHRFIKEITKICKKEQIDIINIHNGGTYCDMIYVNLKKKNNNVKFVRTLHSCYEEKYNQNGNVLKNKLTMFYINKSLQISDLIICVSNAVKNSYFNKFNLSKKNITIIYNGIDKNFFNIKKTNKTYKTNNIIYIGRLEKVKGVNILIDAIAILKSKYNIKLRIVGDGSERGNLESQVNSLGLNNQIIFLGTRRDVISLLDDSDIFVYPSIWEEAFGISVVEAMSRGCIPITFKKGGLTEIITNGLDGFLVDDVSAQSLSQIIEKVINYNDKEQIIKSAIYKSKKFTIDETIKRLKEEYTNIYLN